MDAWSGVLGGALISCCWLGVLLVVILRTRKPVPANPPQAPPSPFATFAPIAWPVVVNEEAWGKLTQYVLDLAARPDSQGMLAYTLSLSESTSGINPLWIPKRARPAFAAIAWTMTSMALNEKLPKEQRLQAMWEGLFTMQVFAVAAAITARVYEEERVP